MNPSKVEAAREDLERKAILGDFEWAHEYIENDLISWLKEKSEGNCSGLR